MTAREHYLREKARRAHQAAPNSALIAAAKQEYLALLASEAAKGKGGRPKRKPPAPDTQDFLEDEAAGE